MAGTVVRDDGMVMDAFRGAISRAGLGGQDMQDAIAYAHETMGLPKFVVFAHIFGDGHKAAEALSCFSSLISDYVQHGRVSAIPGAQATLASLRLAGTAVCLTTGFSAEVQKLLIDHLGWSELVDFSLAPSPGLRGRPYPDMVWTAALKAGVEDIREVAVVGDTASDLWSGWRAGASVVAGVLSGNHTRAELEAAPHTHVLASVADLPLVLT